MRLRAPSVPVDAAVAQAAVPLVAAAVDAAAVLPSNKKISHKKHKREPHGSLLCFLCLFVANLLRRWSSESRGINRDIHLHVFDFCRIPSIEPRELIFKWELDSIHV